MYLCPISGCRLIRTKIKGGNFWYSPESSGRLLNLVMVKHYLGEHAASEIWLRASVSKPGKYKCPGCKRGMHEVKEPGWMGNANIDVCRVCSLVWFDKGEHPEIPHHTDIHPAVEELKQKIAHQEIQLQSLSEAEQKIHQPESLIHSLPAFLMLPVKSNSTQFPVKTLFIILVAVLFYKSSDQIDFLTKLYLPFNLYFFYLFSSDLEGELDNISYLLYIGIALLIGASVPKFFHGNQIQFGMFPMVISIIALSILWPLNARYSYLMPAVHYFHADKNFWSRLKGWRWLSMPQWLVVLFFIFFSIPWLRHFWNQEGLPFILSCVLTLQVLWSLGFRKILEKF